MSFPFESRASFRDRGLGKSSDEFLDDMLKNIKERKKEFFQSRPKMRSQGMFDDELGSSGGSRFKAHLGDLASRHPELADHLFDLLPEDRKTGTIPKERGKTDGPKPSKGTNIKEGAQPQTVTTGTQTGGGGLESDIKLRSTVPDMQASAGETDGDRGQRSQSAPPQTTVPNLSTQKEEGIRLIPIRTDSPSGIHQTGPQIPRQPFQMPQQPSPFPQHQGFTDQGRQDEPKVRHIPIFVEGRDEPIINKDTVPNCTTKRGGCQGKPEPPPADKKQSEKYQQQQSHEHNNQQPQQTHYQQQTHHPQQHQQQQQQQQQHTPTPPPPPQKPDPLAMVADVMKEVEALSLRVNEWKGNSRTEKEYIYLDEMLTRNLLKLDNIVTEGRDEVRTARKEAIRRIQAAISILESKSERSLNNHEKSEGGETTEENSCEPMNVDDTNEAQLQSQPELSSPSSTPQNGNSSISTQT